MSQFKFGLSNSNELLNRIRKKYRLLENDQNKACDNGRTFREEDSLNLDPLKNKQSSIQKQSKDRTELHVQLSQAFTGDNLNLPTNNFASKLILLKMKESLKIYEKDLVVLQENREYLEEKIQVVAEKIRKLEQVEWSNGEMNEVKKRKREQLQELINEYQLTEKKKFHNKLKQQEMFNELRKKIRLVLDGLQQDQQYIAFVTHWNYIQSLLANAKAITASQNEVIIEKKPLKIQEAEENKTQQVVRKKLSESQKASLLGDLKSFAKNFKFPTNP